MGILAAFMVPHPPMIVPAVGRGGEKQIGKTTKAYERVADEIAALSPDTIIITSPHSVMYTDYFHISPGRSAGGDFGRFRASQVRFEEDYDAELVRVIAEIAGERGFPAGVMGERDKRLDHGTMVPLYFIRQKYSGGKIVRIGLSGLPLTEHYRLGQMIREAVERLGRKAVFVASGDLSHKLQDYGPYGFAKEGPQYDERIMDVCSRASFGELFDFDETFCDRAAECGHRSFVIMAGAFDGTAVKAEQLSHEDVTGVGYGICTFYPQGSDPGRRFLEQYLAQQEKKLEAARSAEDPYVRLARASVEHYILHHKRLPMPQDLPSELSERRAGAFVSIHEHGRLRGCIGTIAAVQESLAKEIIENAVSASTRDPRFDPIRADELAWLEISVDVLGDPEPISSSGELDVKRYGVIVTKGRKRGLLLPDLDGVDTVEQQISIAKSKAGIAEWDKDVQLQRFEVVRHH
ncbi:MAG: AmmeMemoRadiSam system protein A [Lachnospiraceae bacterium]|nr:AmmeMemoRadiSam system protein A [Lachnospiraceae bacterium]